MSVALPSNTALSVRTATGPDVYTEIPGVFEFNPGDRTADVVDTTDFDSPNDSEENEAGIIRSSNGSFSFNWEPGNATQEMLRAAKGLTKVFRTLDSAGAVNWQGTFSAIILGVSNPRSVGQKKICTVTIKLTGDITEVDVP